MEQISDQIDAVVFLPYTQREIPDEKRSEYRKQFLSSDPESSHRLSHFSARAIKTGVDLARMNGISKFVLTGEESNPSTADLAESYLKRRIRNIWRTEDRDFMPAVFLYPNRNGTQQQLDAVADLQAIGKVGPVLIPVFEFHIPRVSELVDRWGIQAEVVEIELAQERYLQHLANKRLMETVDGVSDTEELRALIERAVGKSSVRDKLVNLSQVQTIAKAEQGIPQLLSRLDAPFGRTAPFARTAKAILGPTLTDIDQVGMPRLRMTKTLHTPRQRNDLRSFVKPGKTYLLRKNVKPLR